MASVNMRNEMPSVCLGVLVIVVGSKLVAALGRHWHIGPLLTALVSGAAAGLLYWLTSRLLGFMPGRMGRWTPFAVGILCGIAVLGEHLIDLYDYAR